MRWLQRQVVKTVLISSVLGCGFNPGAPGESLPSGSAASSGTGTGTGAGGVTGNGTGIGLTSGGGGDVGPGTGGMSCGQSSVPVMPEPPDILIVQDKSLSMNQDSSGANCNTAGCSKWSQVSAAMDTVVMATQGTVNWGLIFFGSDNMCGVNTTPSVPIAVNNYTAVSGAYAGNQPSSYTPTESAVNAAVAYMKTVTDPNPKYLLLATDGLPNCKPGDRTVTDDDSPGATTAVMNAAAAGFNTFVVGIGNTMGDATLNNFAMAGGEPQTGSADGNSFYEVNSTADLVTALTKIVGIVASCTIPLTGVPTNLTNVAVSVDDASGNPTK
ncbi:MAG TPA: vWA domain-containing protein, partial [Polyangia bacterium]|nr:vWA domain-containing protein [Polyangia bacterium]